MRLPGLHCWLVAALAVPALPSRALAQIPEDILNRDNAPRENPHRFDGSVMSEDGPATNVEVLLEITDMRIRRQVGFERTRTDANGEFSFDLSRYETQELGLQFNTVSPRFIETMKIMRVRWEELPGRVDLEVEPGIVATGRVVDWFGNPIKGAKLEAPRVRQATTNEKGEFEVFGLPPNAPTQLRTYAPGYSDGFLNVQPMGEEKLIEGLEVTLSKAAPLTGRIIDPLGKPVRGRLYFRTDEAGRSADIDENGEFSIEGVPIETEMALIEYVSEKWLPLSHRLTTEELLSRRVQVQLERGVRLGGKLTSAEGQPAAGAQVIFLDPQKPAQTLASAIADAEGRYVIPPRPTSERLLAVALPPANEPMRAMGELEFLREGAPGTWQAEVAPWPKGYSSAIEVTLNGADLTMRRRDSGKGGLPGDVIYKGKLDPEKLEVTGTLEVPTTGAKGTFRAKKYESSDKSMRGTWDLREEVTAGATNLGPSKVEVSTGLLPGIRQVELKLSPGRVLSGRAMRDASTPFTRGRVMLADWDGLSLYRREAPVRAGGEFELDGLPEGMVRIYLVDDEGENISPPTWAITGSEDFVIHLVPPIDPPMDEIE